LEAATLLLLGQAIYMKPDFFSSVGGKGQQGRKHHVCFFLPFYTTSASLRQRVLSYLLLFLGWCN
jgi:hypothetical protein